MSQETLELLIQFIYLFSTVCFILALKFLNAVKSAKAGVVVGVLGMFAAVVGTLLKPEIQTFEWLAIAIVVGAAIGIPLAMMPMTAVPQRTALSHSFGALAVSLVGAAEFYLHQDTLGKFELSALVLEVLFGSLTFTASLMAFGKLQGILPSRPITYKGQNIVNLSVFAIAIGLGVFLVVDPTWSLAGTVTLPALILLALVFGVFLIIPIGGADMPTVLSLLNSYAGLSASMMGFVLGNKLLIVAGALDGSSGLILSIIMCKAMNRSFLNVLFGGFGQDQTQKGAAEQKAYRSFSAEEAAELMRTSTSVVIVPGYGMAVAQAQHKVRELYDLLTCEGVEVTFAIHPVAGRMPGHMNVLLAEADIPYDKLVEMEEANEEFPRTDVVLIIGANDVTNPAARSDKSSPIYGMPILEVDKARTVLVIKRSMNPGFAGIDNDLYYMDKTTMIFGDAKAVVADIVRELGETD